MRIVFDQATPVPIRPYLAGHTVQTAAQLGWDKLRNGDLLIAAEEAGFDLLLTTDKNIRYQQNLAGRRIAIIVLGRQQWPQLHPHIQRVIEAVNIAARGSYTEVHMPPTGVAAETRSALAQLPSVRARITMLPELEHSRWPNRGRYMPHIVVGDPSQRQTAIDSENRITEKYLGILVDDATEELAPGQTVNVTLVLMYWPDETYAEVVPDAWFTLREGPKIVGFGQVISKMSGTENSPTDN
jgi:hypothetical protein